MKEQAQSYKQNEIKNIAELGKVSVDIEVKEEVANKGKEDEFSFKYCEVNDIKYRIPNGVFKQLKALLAEKASLKSFKVLKSGEGMSTSYMVVPLE
jgi:hypothetical protein